MTTWIYQHPILSLEAVPVTGPSGTHTHLRLVLPDWCNVLAITPDRQLVLVRQPRTGLEALTLEVPGGGVDPGEDPLLAAQRELREETGYGGGEWLSLGFVHPNPALQGNRTFLFVALGVTPLGAAEPDEGEEVSVELHPSSRVLTLIDEAEITHALAVCTLERAMRHTQVLNYLRD